MYRSILILVLSCTLQSLNAQTHRLDYIQVINLTGVPDSANAVLVADKNRSLYCFGKEPSPITAIGGQIKLRDSTGFQYYADHTNRTFTNREILLSKPVIVKDDFVDISWEIFPDSVKQIDAFVCKKAIGNFRGRRYVVWYTEEIALPVGPWKLQGLPGAILEGHDDNHVLSFRFKGHSTIHVEIKPPVGSQIITQAVYVREFKRRLDNLMKYTSANATVAKGFKVKSTAKFQVLERSLYDD